MSSKPAHHRVLSAWLMAFLVLSPVFATPVHAAARDGYSASIESFTYPQNLTPGQVVQVSVTARNIGTATWQATGNNYTSLYRWDPVRKVELNSQLVASGWKTNQQPVRLAQTVKPGQTVTLNFSIKAPAKTGSYQESFTLTAENLARMKFGSFDVMISVGTNNAPAAPAASAPTPAALTNAEVVDTTPSLPAAVAGWSAQLTDKLGSEWQISAEQNIIVPLHFKNTGTETWLRDGKNYPSIYAVDTATKERASSFKDLSWSSSSQAAKMVESQVKPGQTATFKLELRGPLQPGFYQERFQLAAEDKAWITGGQFTLPIRVPISATFVATAPPDFDYMNAVEDQKAPQVGYTAALLLRSSAALSLLGNGSQQINIGFKNTGTKTWGNASLRIKGIEPALSGAAGSVRDESWLSSAEPVRVNLATKPGEMALLTFKVKAPAKKGTYKASFKLHADGIPVEGGDIDIPITVTADGYIEPIPTPAQPIQTVPSTPSNNTNNNTTPSNSSVPSINPVPLNGDASSLSNEPLIRVGITKAANDQMTIVAKYIEVIVKSAGNEICRVAKGQSLSIRYIRSSARYELSGACQGQSTTYYTVRAADDLSPIEVSSYSHTYSWLPNANDNKFRMQVELHFSPATGDAWVINELPIEYYLKGIAETSNGSPQEFQRTLITTARTYAMYHVQRQTKHATKYFTVDAEFDQVYRGYGSEARMNNLVAAVDATRGQVVTYAGQVAITPYFSSSDGRTRGWSEVWGGTPPAWLVSVPVPWDNGKTLLGHGVGMSASGAVGMAVDGKKYDEILRYFYRGTELRKAYK